MATSEERNKPLNRPKKSETARARRLKIHRKRLVALGLPADKVARLDSQQMRTLLRRPKKTAKQAQRAKKT